MTEEERAEAMRRAAATPAFHPPADRVFHYSDDATIERFVPHVPPSNPGHPPAVWAIDATHSPLYWFPRHCPRVSVWANDAEQQAVLSERFGTEASRICAAETGWLDRIRTCRLYRYEFPVEGFRPWSEADGQYITDEVVHPDAVVPLDDLLALHASAEVELRITPRLGSLTDQILESQLPFSFVRLRDARR